jgi:3-deoxy-manno-octulosonate cytidylyltransferase (CMP-KDO synthetase)
MTEAVALRPIAVIPAHLASVRFPRKVLFPFHGLPMIEHVRRRALLADGLGPVYVATCDDEVADVVRGFGGKVIMTSTHHRNGTTRVAEAVAEIDCTHVVLLQGDEPLLLPRHLEMLLRSIAAGPGGDAWNATGPIESPEELDRHSFVKCAVAESGRILYCFRRSPGYSEFEQQRRYIRKILGLIAYRREILLRVSELAPSVIEEVEFIEQMRLLEHGLHLRSVAVHPSLPSVNEPHEANIVLAQTQGDPEQARLLARTLR